MEKKYPQPISIVFAILDKPAISATSSKDYLLFHSTKL
jgi:hypothetical protein